MHRCLSFGGHTESDNDVSSPTTTLSSESDWLDIVEAIPFECVYQHLKLLDAYLVGQWTVAGCETDPNQQRQEDKGYLRDARDEWMVRDLVVLGVCCEVKMRNSERGHDDDTKPDSDDDLLKSKNLYSNVCYIDMFLTRHYRSASQMLHANTACAH
jgi:hypothetical protein